jgi:ubiquilin
MDSPLGQMMQQMNSSAGMLGGGLGFPMAPQPADPRPPEERFEVQLGQLQAMGFTVSTPLSLSLSLSFAILCPH